MVTEDNKIISEFNIGAGYCSQLGTLFRIADGLYLNVTDPTTHVQIKNADLENFKQTMKLIAVKIKYYCPEKSEIETAWEEVQKVEEEIKQGCEAVSYKENRLNGQREYSNTDYQKHMDNTLTARAEIYMDKVYDCLHRIAAKNNLLMPVIRENTAKGEELASV